MKDQLQRIHNQLRRLKQIQDMNPDLKEDLADIWNSLIDLRVRILKETFTDIKLNEFGLRETLLKVIEEKL